jgi:hypothetical protein
MFACHRGQLAFCHPGRPHAAVLMAMALATGMAAAQEISPGSSTATQAGAPRPLLELSSSELLRFDDSSNRLSRTGLTLFPASGPLVGLSIGVTGSSGPASAAGLLTPYVPGAPMLDLGLHWRYELDGSYRLDVTAWRRVGNADAMSLIQSLDPNYGVRAEMGFASNKGPRAGFVADRGFVGLQLDGGARLTVKRSGRSPMLYYRNNF